ncbi:MAG: hypothetical protein ACJ8NS_12330 [Chthoniobacterales bacterium]
MEYPKEGSSSLYDYSDKSLSEFAPLTSPEHAAALTPEQSTAVARGVAWLRGEHLHVPNRWDY